MQILLLFCITPVTGTEKKPFFNLEKGDWFVLRMNNNRPMEGTGRDLENKKYTVTSTALSQTEFKCTLEEQLPDNDLRFHVQVLRVRQLVQYRDGTVLGADSRYPDIEPIAANIPPAFPTYRFTVNPDGVVTNLVALSGGTSTIQLAELSNSKPNRTTTSVSETVSFELVRLITDLMTMPLKTGAEKAGEIQGNRFTMRIDRVEEKPAQLLAHMRYKNRDILNRLDRKTRVPLAISDKDELEIVLLSASFPYAGNTVITGQMPGNSVDSLVLHHNYHLHQYNIKKDGRGQFIHYLNLTESTPVFFEYQGQTVPFLLFPGDSLHVEIIDDQSISDAMLTGSAAAQSLLYKAMYHEQKTMWSLQVRNNRDWEKYVAGEKLFYQKTDQLLASYKATVPRMPFSFIQEQRHYFRLYNRLKTFSRQLAYNRADTMPQNVTPKEILTSLDNINLSTAWFTNVFSYQQCIEPALDYKMFRLNNKRHRMDFYQDYFLAISLFKQYSLYKQLSGALQAQIGENSPSQNIRLEPMYTDFINRCDDTVLTAPVKEQWLRSALWKPGNDSPINYLVLADGSRHSLDKYKGKPLVILISRQLPVSVGRYLDLIKKADPGIQFVIGQVPHQPRDIDALPLDSAKKAIFREIYKPANYVLDSTVTVLPNVTTLELLNDSLSQKEFGVNTFQAKLIFLDSWQRVVNMTIGLPNDYQDIFNRSLEEAVQATKYTPAEKAVQRNILFWVAGSVLLTILLGSMVYWFRLRTIKNRERLKRHIKELETKAVRSQMNPHFIFNALNSIQSLITAGKLKVANIYLAEFAALLRGVLHSSDKKQVSLSEELEAVSRYCRLEQLRFGFDYAITVDEEHIHADLIEIPGMIIQPLVENALVHGLKYQPPDARLTIDVRMANGFLYIAVEDNGTGLAATDAGSGKHNQLGLKLVTERVAMFNGDRTKNYVTLENGYKNGELTGVKAMVKLIIH